jgi:hypothetical protein
VGRRAAAVVVEVIQVDDAPAHSPFGPASYGRHGFDDAPDGRPVHRPHIALIGLGTVLAVIVLVALLAGGASTGPRAAATLPAVTTSPRRPGATAPAPAPVTVAAVAAVAAAAGTPQDQAGESGPPLARLYLPDLPAAYRVISADQTYPYRSTPEPGVSQLWSDRQAGAGSPRWLRIDASDDAESGQGWGSVRLATVNGMAVVSSNEFGGVSLTGPIAGGAATVTTAGMTFAETLAALDGAAFSDDTIRFLPGAVPVDFRMVATSQPSEGAQGAVIRPFDFATMTLGYANVVDPSGSLRIDSTAGETPIERVWDDYTVPVRRQIDLGGGRTATVRATSSADQAWSWVDVEIDGESFRISGSAPVADAVGAARTLHLVGADQWTPLQDLAGRNQEAHPVAWYTMYRDVASGTVDGQPWKVLSARGAEVQPDTYLVDIGGDNGLAVPQADTPDVHAVADQHATVVVGTAPAAQPGAVLRVTVGTVVFVTPLVTTDGGGNLVGAVAFADLGIPEAEVIDAGGNVLATLASPTN